MPQKSKTRPKTLAKPEYDSVYFLKILAYLVVGSLWLAWGGQRWLPAGLILGVAAAAHERLRIDRKIEYALLLVGAVLGLVGIGITIILPL